MQQRDCQGDGGPRLVDLTSGEATHPKGNDGYGASRGLAGEEIFIHRNGTTISG